MKLVLIAAMAALAGAGGIAVTRDYAFHDVRRLPQPAAAGERAGIVIRAATGSAANNTTAAPTEKTTIDFLTAKQDQVAAFDAPPKPVDAAEAARRAGIERVLEAEAEAHRQAELERRLGERLKAALELRRRLDEQAQARAETEAERAREHARLAAFDRLASPSDQRLDALDQQYFKGISLAGCANDCIALTAWTAQSKAAAVPAPNATVLKRIEDERDALEQVRAAIEDDHAGGRLPLEHYKRLMARYQSGIRMYKTAMSSRLADAD